MMRINVVLPEVVMYVVMSAFVGETDVLETYAGSVREYYGSAFFLKGGFFQFPETLCGCQRAYDDRDDACYFTERSLYLSDQLNEGQHGSV